MIPRLNNKPGIKRIDLGRTDTVRASKGRFKGTTMTRLYYWIHGNSSRLRYPSSFYKITASATGMKTFTMYWKYNKLIHTVKKLLWEVFSTTEVKYLTMLPILGLDNINTCSGKKKKTCNILKQALTTGETRVFYTSNTRIEVHSEDNKLGRDVKGTCTCRGRSSERKDYNWHISKDEAVLHEVHIVIVNLPWKTSHHTHIGFMMTYIHITLVLICT